MLVCAQVAGDPRRPAEIKRYQRPVANPDDAHTDALLIAALIFGMAGLMFKASPQIPDDCIGAFGSLHGLVPANEGEAEGSLFSTCTIH